MIYIANYITDTGAITSISSVDSRSLEYYTDSYVTLTFEQYSSKLDTTHYVLDGVLVAFTPNELEVRTHLPVGWVWQMPERIAVDPRNAEQQQKDALATVIGLRVAAYPTLGDFADALYWQTQGQPQKMVDYLFEVGSVKTRYPKPM